jgi:hypothetical protein
MRELLKLRKQVVVLPRIQKRSVYLFVQSQMNRIHSPVASSEQHQMVMMQVSCFLRKLLIWLAVRMVKRQRVYWMIQRHYL